MKRIYYYLLLIIIYIAIPVFIKFAYPSFNPKNGYNTLLICYFILNFILVLSILKTKLWLKIILGLIILPISALLTFMCRKIDWQNLGINVNKSLIIFFLIGVFSALTCEFFYQISKRETKTVS
ncbi:MULTISPECIES: hypothetical protein [Flavobacterium]|uniref:hypothetical protein n=1 Tax=Flavobacterium TaxID=237 RepID=UPI001FCABC2D|nr:MULTISPECIES: hypothetical protein [Flavobacterium]UOK42162.1 hypothetical protein LZF87_12690 [Flavobacterium enshiense]